MRLLLDTHILIWVLTGDRRLDASHRRLIANPRNTILVSAVAIWEIRLKWGSLFKSGARRLAHSPQDMVALIEQAGWSLVPLRVDHAVATLDHLLPHRDPFDELLLTQAQVDGLRLVTDDDKLEHHPLALYA